MDQVMASDGTRNLEVAKQHLGSTLRHIIIIMTIMTVITNNNSTQGRVFDRIL